MTLYPIYHPAAALYTPAMLKTLEEDFARIPALLSGAGPSGTAQGAGDRRSRRRGARTVPPASSSACSRCATGDAGLAAGGCDRPDDAARPALPG